MPLIGNVLGNLTASVGATVSTGVVTGGSPGPSSVDSSPVATPVSTGAIPTGLPIATWAIQASETLYLNASPELGPTAWVACVVRYVFGDGNAVLTREPNIVVYTGGFAVGTNLRRKSETYTSTYPGP